VSLAGCETHVMSTRLRFFLVGVGPRGKALRTVMVEPIEGGDDEFDEVSDSIRAPCKVL